MPDFFVELRKQRKRDLQKFLRDNPGMSLEKALAVFSGRTGLRLTKIKEYYSELDMAGCFEYQPGQTEEPKEENA